MTRIVIDLDDAILKKAQKQADADRRSRKQSIELIIEKYFEAKQ